MIQKSIHLNNVLKARIFPELRHFVLFCFNTINHFIAVFVYVFYSFKNKINDQICSIGSSLFIEYAQCTLHTPVSFALQYNKTKKSYKL